ncbi:MAG: hypothetical protein PW788_09610 [Micavibrio sp.]|nr:hypothetical protein [Micavibrio sp.]
MATFGKEYSTDYAYFIAGGKTLDAIKQYEADAANPQQAFLKIAQSYGAEAFFGSAYMAAFVFANETSSPAFKDGTATADGKFEYAANSATPEGKKLLAELANVPDMDLTHRAFARRLTGTEYAPTNPDKLYEDAGSSHSHYSENHSAVAASFSKYGDTYVVSVPRVVRGIFNEAAQKAPDERYTNTIGYTYEWLTPADSTPIPYSKVIELREQTLGEQLTPRVTARKIPSFR